MRNMKKWIVSAGVVLVACLAFVAFNSDLLQAGTHTQGALICSNCHTMHYSKDGAQPGGWGTSGPYPNLLIDEKTNNAICLACHDDNGADASGAPTVFSVNGLDLTYYPGGDFNLVGSGTGANGHFKKSGPNLVVDDTPATAPGSNGGVNSSDLACWSCHDPHNSSTNTNSYRLLRKQPQNGNTGASYAAGDVTVTALASALGANDESSTNHSTFRAGISEWCGVCHSDSADGGTGYHGNLKTDADVGDNTDWLRHPTDFILPAGYKTEYDVVADADHYGIPLEDVDSDWATGTARHDTSDGGNEEVMCLSCHRAHVGRAPGNTASYYTDALRWDSSAGLGSEAGCNGCHNK